MSEHLKYQERVQKLLDGFGNWFEDPVRRRAGEFTSTLYPYRSIFSPIRINSIEIKNRLVMGPMGNISVNGDTGQPTNKMVLYFAERAKGGVGLITSGLVPVSQGIDPAVTEPGDLSYFPRIDGARSRFAPWRDIAEICHGYGARFFIQLTPGLGRVGSPECLMTKYKLPVSASWNPNFYMPSLPCRPLRDGQLRKIVKKAGQAAADAKALLIDGVYLHGHEGYLLEQMSNPAFNRRRLGRYSDWKAFGIDLVREIRKRTGPSYPVMYRIDLSLAFNETYGDRMSTVKSLRPFRNERTVDMSLEYIAELVKAGVDLFDVDLGGYDNWWLPHPPGPMPPGVYLEMASVVKEYFAEHSIRSNAGLKVPVVGVGKLGYPDLAEEALRSGKCDMIMLARPLLADPEWPKKAFSGQVHRIRPCIGDQEACLNEFLEGGHVQCAVNPRTGFEDIYNGSELVSAASQRRIAVVGGGPAGIISAVTAARRGHRVVLFEKERELGGMLRPGSRPAIKFDVLNYRRYLEGLVADVVSSGGLALRLGTAADAASLKAEGFDVIVCAGGSRPARPSIEGLPEARGTGAAEAPAAGPAEEHAATGQDLKIVDAVDLLNKPEIADPFDKIVIIGGGDVGCETAWFLAGERKKNITLIEMLPDLMKGSCTANRGWLLHHLEKAGVEVLNSTTVLRVGAGRVVVRQNVHPSVPDPYNTWNPLLPENIENPLAKKIREDLREKELAAELVVVAVGGLPDDRLYRACVEENAAPELHILGDAFQPGRVFEAVKAAYQVGTSI